MRLKNITQIVASAVLSTVILSPVGTFAQTTEAEHDRAVQRQTEKDHKNHTGAKIVGGSAVGGAVVGGLLGGGKGALIGGAAGAGGGAIGNRVRKDKAVKKREQRDDSSNYPR